MKHIALRLTLICLIASLILAACAPASSGSNGSGQVTLTVWDYYGDTTPIKPLITAFEAENPGIKVKFEELGWTGFWTKLAIASAAGGRGADLVTTGLMWAPQYKVLGLYADLMPLSQGKINGKPLEDVFPKGLLDAARESDQLFGIPYDFDAYALYYRADAFAEVGVTEPPKTWDEYLEVCKKLTQPPNRYGTVVLATWSSFDPLLYAFGGSYFDENGKSVINSPEAIQALQYYIDLVNQGAAINWTTDMGDRSSALKSGKILSFINGPYMMGVMRTVIPEQSGKWRVAMLPSAKSFGTHIGGTHLAILNKSEHKAEAWKLIEFLMRPENQAKVWTISGAGPAYLPALDLPEVNAGDPFFGDQSTASIFRDTVEQGVPNPTIKKWGDVSEVVSKAIEAALAGKKSPEQALNEAAVKIDKLTGK